MYIRFVVQSLNPTSGRRQGLFQAARELRDSGRMTGADFDRLDAIEEWFNQNLERPSRLSLSPRPNKKSQAISWFKTGATRHIKKMREFQQVLESYGMAVKTIKTNRPGYVVYEDEWQVAAYPFSETPT